MRNLRDEELLFSIIENKTGFSLSDLKEKQRSEARVYARYMAYNFMVEVLGYKNKTATRDVLGLRQGNGTSMRGNHKNLVNTNIRYKATYHSISEDFRRAKLRDTGTTSRERRIITHIKSLKNE